MEKTLLRQTEFSGNNCRAFHTGDPLIRKFWNEKHLSYLPQILHFVHVITLARVALILGNKLFNFSFDCGPSGKNANRESRANGFYSALVLLLGASPAVAMERNIAAGFQSLRLDTGYYNPEGHGAAFKVLYYVKELVKWQKK